MDERLCLQKKGDGFATIPVMKPIFFNPPSFSHNSSQNVVSRAALANESEPCAYCDQETDGNPDIFVVSRFENNLQTPSGEESQCFCSLACFRNFAVEQYEQVYGHVSNDDDDDEENKVENQVWQTGKIDCEQDGIFENVQSFDDDNDDDDDDVCSYGAESDNEE